ncbi:MAG: radical SAM protein [Candidatus Thiodiazotropha sp.]
MITFGPVPSRRLGRSLGINNIPPKACSYACVYCQVGATLERISVPRAFYAPEEVLADVESRLQASAKAGAKIDYLTFVPDGEPTLDINLGTIIRMLRRFDIPIAVISNGSLLWREEVRERLQDVDWLSVKVDTTDEPCWRKLNRPEPSLGLSRVLTGIRGMSETFQGRLHSETMLLAGINDSDDSVKGVADYLAGLALERSYLAVPTRPVLDARVRIPHEAVLNRAYQLLSERLPRVEYLIGYEGDDFVSTGEPAEDLLAIAAVHPLREEAVRSLLKQRGADWSLVERLLAGGELKLTEYQGIRYYVRRPGIVTAPV